MSSFSRAIVSHRDHHNNTRERNPSGPAGAAPTVPMEEEKPRRIRNVTSANDRSTLEKHYSFVPKQRGSSSWQERMVQTYHSHLYKEFVLADLSRSSSEGRIGLRWRTQAEVQNGKGQRTCGNKHCPSYRAMTANGEMMVVVDPCRLNEYHSLPMPTSEDEERKRLEVFPAGDGLCNYEVPFSYIEHGNTENELVKLRLCMRCAPLLFGSKQEPAMQAFRARTDAETKSNEKKRATRNETSDGIAQSSDSDESSEYRRRQHKRKRKRRRSKHRERIKDRRKRSKSKR